MSDTENGVRALTFLTAAADFRNPNIKPTEMAKLDALTGIGYALMDVAEAIREHAADSVDAIDGVKKAVDYLGEQRR